MSDYRMSFIKSVEESLTDMVEPDLAKAISNVIVRCLNLYELSERCTEVATVDPVNEKLIKKYRACLRIGGKSEGTIYQYCRTVQRLSDFLHEKFTDMGVYDIRYYFACEKERGISNHTLENTRANLSAFFTWLLNEEIIVKNPMAKITPIKYPEEIKKPFSDVEIDKLRFACRTSKERAIVELLLSSGVRVSEACQLDVTDIDFITMDVNVRHGKGDKPRTTYISDVAATHIKQYLAERPESDMVCLLCNNMHKRLEVGGLRHILNVLQERAGVENVHPHRFRRTFATKLASRGMAIQEIQALLGHSNINTTMEYVCADKEKVKSSYRKYIA